MLPKVNVLVIAIVSLAVCQVGCGGTPGTAGQDGDVTWADAEPGRDGGPDGGQPDGGQPDGGTEADAGLAQSGLVINELLSHNEGVNLDEAGETEDWIELLNRGIEPLSLADFSLADSNGRRVPLPERTLAPSEVVLLWADDEPEQGPLHLPFKLSSSGDQLMLYEAAQLVDQVGFDDLGENQSLARLPDGQGPFAACRYPSPGRRNGERCAPAPPPALEDVTFAPFSLPPDLFAPSGPLVINEAALFPAAFVELLNVTETSVSLTDFSLRLAPHGPDAAWPTLADGQEIALPAANVAPGARVSITLPASIADDIAANPEREGVLTLFARTGGAAVARLDFMRWPDDARLARVPDGRGPFRYCTNDTAGAPNQCDPLATREVGDRLRHLRTPGDFSALAQGEHTLGIAQVKFIVDLEAGEVVHLISTEAWPLHYTFVRERIYGEPALDRCDPIQRAEFNAGWSTFSQTEYYQVAGRRFLLGTLSHHSGRDLYTVEYTFGDAISPDQMRQGYFAVLSHLYDSARWALRPQDETQVDKARQIEGTLPIVGPQAPFVDITLQALTQGVGYGTLRFIPAQELGQAPLGPRVIVLTDDVPNDIPFVGGLITEAFQTPLAHVNVLSQNRGTPNMALKNARQDPRIAPYLEQLVRLSVSNQGFSIEPADPAEAQAFWQSQVPAGETLAPRRDTSVRALLPLEGEHGLEALPAIGAKAAQLGELTRVSGQLAHCQGTLPIPRPLRPFAIPVVHYLEHAQASGAQATLDALLDDARFRTEPVYRAEQLADVRKAIVSHPVRPQLLALIDAAVQTRWGNQRVRFRSSSNTEDLPTFSGAGIYTSTSAERGDAARPIDDAVRTVWASLWNDRAYDEREFARIDHSEVAMGILVHPASLSEEANGVAVSRNLLNPNRGDQYYLNLQFGEASVTNPAPGVTTEQLVYQLPPRTPPFSYKTLSSLGEGQVLSPSEIEAVGCALGSIHDHFRNLLDPARENPWFAMEIEFKLRDGSRELVIKQARPHSFGEAAVPTDCREI